MQDTIRVLIADDQEVVRSALSAFLLAYNMEPAGEASNGKEAVRMCSQHHPDVVLMDLVMPEMDGATATKIIRRCWPETRVIAITSFEEEQLLTRAIEAGAAATVLKNLSADEMASTIQAVYTGEITPPQPRQNQDLTNLQDR